MVASRLFTRLFTRPGQRNFSTSMKRLSEDDGGYAGVNLPFNIHNRYKFTVVMSAYLATGFGTPFLVVRHQLLKKSRPQG